MDDTTVPEIRIHDEDGSLSPEFVRAVVAAVEAEDAAAARELTAALHEADLADLIELLKPEERTRLLGLLGKEFDYTALPELDESVLDEVLEVLPQETVAEAVRELDTDDAVYILSGLDPQQQAQILSRVPRGERVAVQRSLEYPEYSAGRLMDTDFVAVPQFWSIGQTIDYMRTTDDLPEDFYEVFVVDPGYHLIGTIPVSRILRTPRERTVQEVMDTEHIIISVDEDQEDVAYKFEQYNLVSAPVIDGDQRLAGVITIDDVVDIIQEEAGEDIHLLGGVGDEAITDTVLQTVRGRFAWLLINVGTSGLAVAVISLFDATIEQMVALAVLMPIVASMGGNAGVQTMTVAVRALATRELGRINALRVVVREAGVGLINGFIFAILVGTATFFVFGSGELGLVIAAAMVVNFIVAGLAGILIPLTLDALGADPAVASTVFLTTLTDVVGFFSFLGLATLVLL